MTRQISPARPEGSAADVLVPKTRGDIQRSWPCPDQPKLFWQCCQTTLYQPVILMLGLINVCAVLCKRSRHGGCLGSYPWNNPSGMCVCDQFWFILQISTNDNHRSRAWKKKIKYTEELQFFWFDWNSLLGMPWLWIPETIILRRTEGGSHIKNRFDLSFPSMKLIHKYKLWHFWKDVLFIYAAVHPYCIHLQGPLISASLLHLFHCGSWNESYF